MRNHTNKFLVAIIALQGVLIVGLWSGQPNAAHAKVDSAALPDPGARQLQMIDELKAMNGKLERLNTLIQSGEVTVKVKNQEQPKR
jgi:hypothetical protein